MAAAFIGEVIVPGKRIGVRRSRRNTVDKVHFIIRDGGSQGVFCKLSRKGSMKLVLPSHPLLCYH